jgi:ribosomal-protein-alanine N-acetyltransferase
VPELRLETARLVLAVPQPDEAALALPFLIRNREHLAPWRPPEPSDFYTEEYWQAQTASIRAAFDDGTAVRLWVWDKSDATRLIGTIGFTQIFRGPFCSCMLGYQLDHAVTGRGLMTEALQAALQYMFTTQQLHRIAANYRPENVRSGKLLARLGFRIDGFAKDYLFIDGAWRDHVLTSLLNDAFKPEWLVAAKR